MLGLRGVEGRLFFPDNPIKGENFEALEGGNKKRLVKKGGGKLKGEPFFFAVLTWGKAY